MKIRLNPDTFGHEEHEGCHCEWELCEDKIQHLHHTFQPTKELPTYRTPNGHMSYLGFRFWEEDEFEKHVEEGNITIVGKNGIRYKKKKHKL